MIKKPVGLLLTAFLTLGLAACNNNRNDINDQTTDQIGRNNNRNNGIVDVRNGRDDGIDHNGPLTEDYSNRNNGDSDLDRNNRNNRNNGIVDVRNGRDNGIDHNGPLTEDYSNRNNSDSDLDTNMVNNRKKGRKNNNNDMISAYQTTLNSVQYPHTKAVLTQDAKYQFIRIDPKQANGFQFGVIQQGQPFTQQQTPIAKAPTPAPAPQQAPAPPPAPAQQQTQQAPNQSQTAPKPAAQTQTNAPTSGTVSQYVQQVIDLTNAQRSKSGLPALKADTQLNGVAQKKSVDMQQNNYFSHTSPTYGSPFDMMRDFGVSYKSAGENIAQGQRTPQEVVTAWMNSEGHRKNILSANYTHIGVGFEESGKHWTQMFIGK